MRDTQVPYQAEDPMEIKTVAVFQFASDEVNNFLYENEELKVFYNFQGKESTVGKLEFKIENKTSQNLFIDLAYSSFINNGRATNYTDAVDIKGKVLLIPDHSYLSVDKFEGITYTNKGEIDALITNTFNSSEKVKMFDKINSPLLFRNKITYGFQENITEPKLIDNHFWVNQLNVYPQEKFDSLFTANKNEFKNKLIYHCSFMGKEKVTKYRTEPKEVKENTTQRKKVFAPGRTIILAVAVVTGVILVYVTGGL